MNKCIIVTSYVEGQIRKIVNIEPQDCIICADGGYDLALAEGITPDVVIGDLDSTTANLGPDVTVLRSPSHKDVTDTALCLDYALDQGYNNVLIVGGLGGRLDHTVANLQNLFHYTMNSMSIMISDEKNIVMALINDEMYLPNMDGYSLSLFSFGERCNGVTVSGVMYPLNNHCLTNSFPLGVSNEFVDEDAYIKVEDGQLLVILSKKN